MQPHFPAIGSIKLKVNEWRQARDEVMGKKSKPSKSTKVDLNLLKNAYKENLRLVLSFALKYIDGNTIITSDHGECLGEKGYIGHSTSYDCDILYKVPVEIIY